MAKRIVFTTGDGASAEIKKFLNEAGNEILFKPFKLEDITKAIALATRN
jgi:transcriptional regulatory protein LevR